MTIIIRSSLDAKRVSEHGLQSQLVNNYDRILKPAPENKRNMESTRLLEGMEVHTKGGNFLPVRHGEESPKDLVTDGFWIFHPRAGLEHQAATKGGGSTFLLNTLVQTWPGLVSKVTA